MKINQVQDFVNSATQQMDGEISLLTEDLSNVTEVGKQIEDIDNHYDHFVKNLFDHIAKVTFIDRIYSGRVPSLLKNDWEYGAIIEKISPANLPEAEEDEAWNLQDGATYEQQMFHKPDVVAHVWNHKDAFSIPISIAQMQVKSAFDNPTQLNAFVSMVFNTIQNSMTVKMDSINMATINNMIGLTMHDEFNATSTFTSTGVKAINLLAEYNTYTGDTYTFPECLTDKGFIRYAIYRITQTASRMKTMSTTFNIGKLPKFTPADKMHFVIHDDLDAAAAIYLQSDTYNKELVSMPMAYETIPYWQGSGDEWDETYDIKIKTSENDSMTITGVLGVIFDDEAAATNNSERRTTSVWNANGEFWNYWFKAACSSCGDPNENFVVFFCE